jgi:molecular chaperone DnaJ
LSCNVPISFATAVLGSSVEVPTLDGQVMLKIPPETQSGNVFRLRGKGVRQVRSSGVGDLFCTVQVETPVKLTDEQKNMLENFDESLQTGGSRHSPRARSWLDGVKRFFERMGA